MQCETRTAKVYYHYIELAGNCRQDEAAGDQCWNRLSQPRQIVKSINAADFDNLYPLYTLPLETGPTPTEKHPGTQQNS